MIAGSAPSSAAVTRRSDVAHRVPPAAARRPSDIARRVPRPQSLPLQPAGDNRGEQGIGHTEWGRISVADSVVARLAARAAVEVDDVGAAARRLLGKEVSGDSLGGGLGKLGMRSSELGVLPSCSAQVDGHLAFVTIILSVRYPASVRQVAAAVRTHVIGRVGQLTGLQVVEVDIKVPSLVRDVPRPQRVH